MNSRLRLARWLLLLAAVGGLSACSTLDSINPFASTASKPKVVELEPLKTNVEARVLWQASVGKMGGYVFVPAVVGSSVYVASAEGSVQRLDDGRSIWRINAGAALSGGVASDGELVVVGTAKGEVLAFAAADGKLLWKSKVSSEVLAPAAVGNGLVIVRSGDYRVTALDAADGKRKWLYQRDTPALSLRSAAPPLLADRFAFVGFPGGKLIAVLLGNGAPTWEGTVALPKGSNELERVADVVAAPVLAGRDVCAVAYQGRVSCFDLTTGNSTWAREVSSAAGLDIDSRQVYVSDDKGYVHAFDRTTGTSLWKQEKLINRELSAPRAVGAYVAVADSQGTVHFMQRDTGAFAARIKTDGTPVTAPLQRFGAALLVQTSGGTLYAIDIQ